MHIFLFDIDGTLIQSGGAGRDAIGKALSREFDVAHPHKIDLGGRTDRGIAREMFDRHEIPETDANWDRFLDAYLSALPDRLQARQGNILPGVQETLAALGELDNIQLGLITGNVRRGAEIKLKYFDLWDHFSFGGFGDNSPSRNDVAREAAEDARQTLQLTIDDNQFCVVGDTILDVRCAKAIGAKSIAVCTGSSPRQQLAAESPDMILEDLTLDGWWRSAVDLF